MKSAAVAAGVSPAKTCTRWRLTAALISQLSTINPSTAVDRKPLAMHERFVVAAAVSAAGFLCSACPKLVQSLLGAASGERRPITSDVRRDYTDSNSSAVVFKFGVRFDK
jgi:hypothetical protein